MPHVREEVNYTTSTTLNYTLCAAVKVLKAINFLEPHDVLSSQVLGMVDLSFLIFFPTDCLI